ncbi:MAG: hypothetical protein Q7K39_03065 [Candidatus Magasanikbacteria bacterium]|nr:hypothetical protein [Candidatus Magasanikbacteria bacterium]
MFGLSRQERAVFRKLTSPLKIQNFLDRFPINHEKGRETYMSPRVTLRAGKMHCFEGALVAATALWLHGQEPLILDLKTKDDWDHVVALYKIGGRWGAISKTNHATLRWRDPIYKTVRELAVSYWHEYFDNKTRQKTLRWYSEPYNLSKHGANWITAEEDLFALAERIDNSRHLAIFPPRNWRYIRKADKMEVKAGKLIEWERRDHRT